MNKVGKFQKKKLRRSVGDGVIGNPSLGIPYHTCNATKVARETTVFFLLLLFFVYKDKELLPEPSDP